MNRKEYIHNGGATLVELMDNIRPTQDEIKRTQELWETEIRRSQALFDKKNANK